MAGTVQMVFFAAVTGGLLTACAPSPVGILSWLSEVSATLAVNAIGVRMNFNR